MECTDPRHALLRGRRVGACNDPATLRCGITALQRRKNYGILWSASTALMQTVTWSLHSKIACSALAGQQLPVPNTIITS